MIFGISMLLAFLVALVGTGVLRRRVLKKNVLDIPNARSSHTVPTPRGGGLAIVAVSAGAFSVLAVLGRLDLDLFLVLVGGGGMVAAVGFMDDLGSLSVKVRIVVHFVAALWAVWLLDGVSPIQWGSAVVDFGVVGDIIGVFAIVWFLNLFNFMDGIDGIAASEAVFTAGTMGVLYFLTGNFQSVALPAAILVAASLGFLVWNWAPAKIFMGDVGSGFLGYTLAVLAIQTMRETHAGAFVWLILCGVFFVDATVTLVRRLAGGERVYEAHRTHAYQRLAWRWRSHGRATVTVIAINVVWLLPCAILAMAYPRYAIGVTAGALLPIVVLALLAGAGRREP